jgi:hypothetical protein
VEDNGFPDMHRDKLLIRFILSIFIRSFNLLKTVEDNGFPDMHRDKLLIRFILSIFIRSFNLLKTVEDNGFEPLTPCVQGRCSSQLS